MVLYLDVGNTRSYPGSGSVIRDMSGAGNDGTLNNSPTYSSSNGGILQFNGTTSTITVPAGTTLNLASGQSTVIGSARYSGATRGRMINALNNNWLIGHWSATTENYYAEGWVTGVGVGANDTNWRIVAATGDTAIDTQVGYINGVQTINGSGGSQGPNGIAIAAANGTYEYSTGEFGFVLVYNRILSATEILSVHNAFKSRYSL
jgi:hypothetical protein